MPEANLFQPSFTVKLHADRIAPDVDYEFSRRSSITGDVNLDGLLNHADIDAVCRSIRNPPGQGDPRADFDRNDSNDLGDLRILVNDLIGTSFGDANLDRVFDSSDLVDLFKEAQYEDNNAGNSSWASGDFNCDLEFDSSDLVEAFKGGQYELRLPGFVALRPQFFMPPHTNGDADFDGTPSYFAFQTEMRINDDRTRIETRVFMDALETKGDETRANGWSPWETAYVAPGGHEIVDVLSTDGNPVSRIHSGTYNGDAGTFAGHLPKRLSVDSDLVNQYEMILDTDGEEAGVRSSVLVHFEAVAIELTEPRSLVGVCMVPLAELNWEPPLVRGDNDWFGNGPLQFSFAEIRLRDGDIEGRVNMNSQEWDITTNLPISDFTTFDGWSPWQTLYSGDVTAILSDRHDLHVTRPTDDPDIGIAISSAMVSNLVNSHSSPLDSPGADQAAINIQFRNIHVHKPDCTEALNVRLRPHFSIPRLLSGDREFGGNGPEINVQTLLRIGEGGTRLETRMLVNAIETSGDNPSRGRAYTGWETAYVAPSGQVFEAITSPTVAEFTFTDTDHEPDFIGTSGINLVRRYEIIGDVNGDDIGTTSVRAFFNDATIELRPADSISDDRINIRPNRITFRPPLVRADTDFGSGLGTVTNGFVQTQIVDGELQARVYANIAEGPSGNYSTYDGWSDWTSISSGLVPVGKRIKRILSAASSNFGHIRTSDATAFAFLGSDPVDGVVVLFEGDSLYMEVRFTEIDVELEDIGG